MPRGRPRNGAVADELAAAVSALIKENRALKRQVARLSERASAGKSDGRTAAKLRTIQRRAVSALGAPVRRRRRRKGAGAAA